MKRAQIFATPINERYLVSRLSFAYIFSLVCTTLSIVIPFLACHSVIHDSSGRSEGVWLQRNTYKEQPRVGFNYKLIVIAQASDTASDLPKELYFSTMASINNLR